jgi:hypothetical protein
MKKCHFLFSNFVGFGQYSHVSVRIGVMDESGNPLVTYSNQVRICEGVDHDLINRDHGLLSGFDTLMSDACDWLYHAGYSDVARQVSLTASRIIQRRKQDEYDAESVVSLLAEIPRLNAQRFMALVDEQPSQE